ncbi:MAG: hypothetical protein Cpurp_05555 [Chlorogloea purpurea SAG 13.99]|nr:hypothetical protein [Chlorogloea purpurea SAG 13.99]
MIYLNNFATYSISRCCEVQRAWFNAVGRKQVLDVPHQVGKRCIFSHYILTG